jgi:gluconate:H+ symporter, GntP family
MMLSLALLVVAVAFIVVATTRFQLHPFLALLAAALIFGLGSGMPLPDVATSLREGFGATIGNVGIIIIAGTVIGVFLERSGGAYAIAEAILRRIGRKRVPASMSVIGYVTSIPVFADSGFVILQSLNKALTRRAGLSLATTSMALCFGLMVAHSMLPPTPGPIAAAAALAADLGLVIALAAPISLVVLAASWLFATRIASRVRIDPAPELDEADIEQRLAKAPSAARALLPVFLPLALIMLGSVARLPAQPFGDGAWASAIRFAGDPVIALLLGMLAAFALPAKLERRMFAQSGWVGEAILTAAIIILITGAGGAFGRVLLNSGFAQASGEAMSSWGLGLWLPFAICAVVRAAQGSATVAMITTAGLLAPLLPALGLDSELGRALAVVAIGAGGFFGSHANDSYFWVVTQMSGMTPGQGYRLITTGSCLMSLLAGTLVWIAGWVLL